MSKKGGFFQRLLSGFSSAEPDMHESTAIDSNSIMPDWVMPVEGEIIALAAIPDPAFSSGAIGAGFGIKPSGGQIVAPTAAEVTLVFPTNHAIGLITPDGQELLIHVGLDSVTLQGEGFDSLVKAGDKVSPGTPLLNVDWALLAEKTPSTITPIIFSSMTDGQQIEIQSGKPVLV